MFAGARHDDDDYAGVLRGVARTIPGAVITGCSATGVLTSGEELENASAVAVLALGGDQPLPPPLFRLGVRDDSRGVGRAPGP